jgi:hypothetical protein
MEPALALMEAVAKELGCKSANYSRVQHGAQRQRELAEIIREWTNLPPAIRFSIMALIHARKYPICLKRPSKPQRVSGSEK